MLLGFNWTLLNFSPVSCGIKKNPLCISVVTSAIQRFDIYSTIIGDLYLLSLRVQVEYIMIFGMGSY